MNTITFKDYDTSFLPHILKEIYVDRVYEPFLGGKKDLVIADIGANIGMFSVYAAQFAKRIIAVEPSKEHLEYMEKNLNAFNNIDVVAKAISKENGKANFYHNGNVTMYSLKEAVNNKPDEMEVVDVIDMETFFKENNISHIDFMKLDTEGAEVDIICGKSFENVSDKIKSLVVEYHQWTNTSPYLIVNALKDYGFDVSQIPNDATLFYAERK